MADGYKTIKYKHFDRKKPMENKYTTPKTEIMSRRLKEAPRTGPSKATIERYKAAAEMFDNKISKIDKSLKQKPARKKRPAKPLYDKVYK